MKKKHLLIATVALAIATSCTKDELSTGGSSTEVVANAINFTAHTTRAEVIDISDMQSSLVGFTVYATALDDNGDDYWLLSGAYNYLCTDGSWGWNSSTDATPTWPTDAANYPITFYALYSNDISNVSVSTLTADSDSPISASVTIQELDSQTDLLSTTTKTATKPSDGKLSLVFDHILSKIDFGVIAGTGKTVYITGLEFNNLDSIGSYNLAQGAWTVSEESVKAGYDLASALDGTGVTNSSTTETSDDAVSLTNTSSEKSLMLLPQSTDAWDVATWQSSITDTDDLPTITGSHIVVLYRATEGDDSDDVIGFTTANDHPLYDSLGTAYDGMALFVKVGYPLASDWEKSKNYTYNLKIGTADATNGYILDDVYYDEDGNPTTLPLDYDDKEIGDPISDGYINFSISTSDWSSGTTSSVL